MKRYGMTFIVWCPFSAIKIENLVLNWKMLY